MMIIRDKFYEGLLANSGNITCGMIDDSPVCIWDKINPIIMTQQLIEDFNYDLQDVARLPNRALRIFQYRFDFYEVYPEYGIVLFNVSEIPNSMNNDYWNKLTEWLIYQGYSSDNPVP